MQPTQKKILARIYGKGRGWCFGPKDFQDIGNRPAVDKALSRLHRGGTIRRVARGVYDYPRVSKKLGMQAPPDLDQVAHALARSRGWRIQAAGVWAANLLGLSTQVPAKAVYLTTGPGKSLTVGNTPVEFRSVSPKDLPEGLCGLVIQALKGLGKENVDDHAVSQLRRHLSNRDCRKLLGMKQVTGWVYETIKRICQDH